MHSQHARLTFTMYLNVTANIFSNIRVRDQRFQERLTETLNSLSRAIKIPIGDVLPVYRLFAKCYFKNAWWNETLN